MPGIPWRHKPRQSSHQHQRPACARPGPDQLLHPPEFSRNHLSGAERAEVDFSGERADLIILDCLKLSDFTIEVVEQLLSRICAPLIVFADQSDEGHGQKAMRAGASACIIDGLHEHRIRPLIAIAKERFRMMSEVTEELKRTRDSLSGSPRGT